MTSSAVGQPCGNCYGQGQLPTDQGPVDCPDCGGVGVLPTQNVLVEWRAREIERLLCSGDDQVAHDVRWLIFELRRARSALTQLLVLTEELDADASVSAPARSPVQQMRFIANDALGLYSVAADGTASKPSP